MATLAPGTVALRGSESSDGRSDGQVVDGRGRSISTAILYKVWRAMRELPPGEVITVSTDPLPAVDNDIRAWCRTTGHELVDVKQAAGAREYAIRKAEAVQEQPG